MKESKRNECDNKQKKGPGSEKRKVSDPRCQEPTFTDDFKLYFSVQLTHSPSFKSPFSRSLIIETRQTIHLATQVHGDIKA